MVSFAAEAEDETSKAVLQQIVDLYITIRGFGLASSCLEMYKQTTQNYTEDKSSS